MFQYVKRVRVPQLNRGAKKSTLAAICIVASVSGSALVAKADSVATVYMSQGTYQYGDGGEFSAALSQYTDPISHQVDFISGFSTPQTVFCVETNEEFSYGGPYVGDLSQDVNNNAGQFSVPPTAGEAIEITEAEWLYYQYYTGAIPITSTAQAGALQYAIWTVLGENASQQFSDTGGGAAEALAAATAVNVNGWQDNYTYLANLNPHYMGTVQILNLWTSYNSVTGFSGHSQDQLVWQDGDNSGNGNFTTLPLPATASTSLILLAGLGVVGYAFRKRLPVSRPGV